MVIGVQFAPFIPPHPYAHGSAYPALFFRSSCCSAFLARARLGILACTNGKGTLSRSTFQDIYRKRTQDCAVITPVLQSAHIIATPADVHEVLHTLGVLQMQPIAPPTLKAPMPPSISSDSSAQIVRPGNNV